MCEPHHSIVQYPDRDDDNNPTSTVIDAIQPPDGADPNYWAKLRKKIGNWFNFSILGLGHSESIEKIGHRSILMPSAEMYVPVMQPARLLPRDVKYETRWWDRQVRLDGFFPYHQVHKADSLASATEYGKRVVIGNMTLLRQFLEVSMKKSKNPQMYLEQFSGMLNHKGRDIFASRLKMATGGKIGLGVIDYSTWRTYREDCSAQLEICLKVMFGFTRQRGLLVPEWADDAALWNK